MIRIRFINPDDNTVISDAVPKSVNVGWKLNQTADWSASFPKNLTALTNVSRGCLVQIFLNSEIILDGILQNFGEKWGNDTIDVSLTGRGITDKLFDIRAYSYGYYESQKRLLILALLLDRAGWRLGDVSTWSNPTDTYTIDLRNEKRLLSQITTVLSGFPGIFYRYGGVRAGAYTIDVGAFNTPAELSLYKAAEIDVISQTGEKVGLIGDFNYNQALTAIVNSVEVWGGDVKDNTGVSRTIFLSDALAADPTLATDPDFPIITDLASYIFHIRNNAIDLTVGSQSTERYTQYAPENTGANATLAACKSAGLALYERGVAFLLDHQANPKNISLKAEGEDLYMAVGDTVYVSNTFRQPIIDPFTDQVVDVIDSSIQGYFRVTSLSLDAGDGKVSWSFELTNGTIVTQEDLFVSVYDEATKKNQVQGTAAIVGLNFPELATYTLDIADSFPDTTMEDGSPALLVSIDVPVTGLPAWTPTRMFSAGLPVVSGTDQPIEIEVVQDFAYSTTPLIIKLGVRNSNWNAAISLTLTYNVVWSQ